MDILDVDGYISGASIYLKIVYCICNLLIEWHT